MKVPGTPEFNYFRERKIELEDKPVVKGVESGELVTKDMAMAMYDNMLKVIGKADTLLSEIKRTAPKMIPVHEKALEVRLAIRSLWPGAQDDFITYDQYTEVLDKENEYFNFDPKKTIDLLTGDSFTDSRLIGEVMQESAGIPPEVLAMAGQFAMLLVCNRMLQTFQAPNTQAAVAGKQPPGTEAPATILQVLMGLACILGQTLITERDAKKALEDTFGDFIEGSGMSTDDILTAAKNTPTDGTLKNYTRSRDEEHRANVREYTTNYITMKPGYEAWVASDDIRDIKEDLRASHRESVNYGRDLYSMGKEIYRVTLCGLDRSNDRLNKIAAVLGHKYTRDMLCCFARFIAAIPTDLLKQIRIMLAIAANGISVDLGQAYGNFARTLNAKLDRMFLEPVLHMIDTFFREQKQRAALLMDPSSHPDPETFNNLLLCTPIDDMFSYVLSALDKLQAFVVKYIRKYWEFGRLKQTQGTYKIQILADNKRVGMVLKIVDAVIQSIEAGNLCAQEDSRTMSPEDLDDVMRRADLGLPAEINVEMGDDPYATFSTDEIKEFTTAAGLSIIQEPTAEKNEHGLQDCARARISDKNMQEFLARATKLSEDLANANLE